MESAVNEMKPYLTTQRLLEKFLLLYTELHNTTRMPENYGHTPEELFESERIRRVVGRNDPCPCGSGKKYKKVLRQKRELKKLHQEAFGRGKNPNASFCLKRSKYEIDCARYHCCNHSDNAACGSDLRPNWRGIAGNRIKVIRIFFPCPAQPTA